VRPARAVARVDFGNPQPHISRMLTELREARPGGAAAGAVGTGAGAGVTRLALTCFRNYRDARLALDTELVVLTGPNGAGKTNLLEALSFLAPGRGLRGTRLSEVDRRARDGDAAVQGWAVAATVATRGGVLRIGTGRDTEGGERRVVRIDGEPMKSQTALAEHLGVVWLTPQMDRLFLDGPGARRRFLDRLVLTLDPGHAARVGDYEQALRDRARLLRDGRADPSWLAALEGVIARQGVAVAAARCDAVRRLDRLCAAADGPFPRARLAVLGTVEAWLDDMPALEAEARFAAALVAARPADALAGGAAQGPHRSDLAVSLAQSGVGAEAASTGEQKALLIAIVLAHVELQRNWRGAAPLLLLDEAAAHLDASRRAALFAVLARIETQVWMTGTDEALFAPLRRDARFLSVRDGVVAAAPN
jgi:DNA replication and repair protein RecF